MLLSDHLVMADPVFFLDVLDFTGIRAEQHFGEGQRSTSGKDVVPLFVLPVPVLYSLLQHAIVSAPASLSTPIAQQFHEACSGRALSPSQSSSRKV
jgi:hypothetical protein